MEFAFQRWGMRRGRSPSKKELGEAVAARLQRKRFGGSTVGAWFGGSRPDPEIAVALARVLGVDVGWLYFNGDTAVPAPDGWESFGAGATDPGLEAAAAIEAAGLRNAAHQPDTGTATRRRAQE